MSIDAMKLALHTLEGWANHGDWVWPESALEQAKRNTTESITALRAAIEQSTWVKSYAGGKPNYTTPEEQTRQWQGLTDEEIGLLTTNDKWSHIETPVLALFARAIEAKLKEKNARPIKPLTDEEIDTYFQEYINTGSLLSFADGVRFAEAAHSGAIEAKLKEKNT